MCLQIKHPASVLQLSRVKQQGMRRRHVGSEMLHDLQVKKPKAAKPAAAAAPAEGAAPLPRSPRCPFFAPRCRSRTLCSQCEVCVLSRRKGDSAAAVKSCRRHEHAVRCQSTTTLIAMETKNKPQGSSHAWCADNKA